MKQPSLARDLVPINDFRSNLKAWLGRVEAGRSIVVTQRGRAAAVVVAPEAVDAAEEERRFLRGVVRGLRDVEAGRVLDDEAVWNELDTLMAHTEGPGEGPVE